MKAIIFDLDGVICSTDEYHYKAWKKLADELGIFFDREINNRLRGVSRMESLNIILENGRKQYSDLEKIALAERKNQVYKELLKQMSTADLSVEVWETLQELRKKGYKLAVGSSSKNAKFILKQLGLEGFFDAIADGTDISFSKPNPEVFLLAAERLCCPPELCLVVEDATAGIEAAVRGGFTSAGIGMASKAESVTYPINQFSDLLMVVDGKGAFEK